MEVPGWITYNNFVPLGEWLQQNRPSSVTNPMISWISVDDAVHKRPIIEGDAYKACEEWERLVMSQKPTVEDIDNLALKYNILVGKWLIFDNSSNIDRIWGMVASATVEGRLGCAAKVSLKDEKSQHVICVYTNNYMDSEEVDKVRDTLKDMGIRAKLSYKPDIYTYFNIYAKNPWGLYASKYWK